MPWRLSLFGSSSFKWICNFMCWRPPCMRSSRQLSWCLCKAQGFFLMVPIYLALYTVDLNFLCILLTVLLHPFLLATLHNCHTLLLHFLSEFILKTSLSTLHRICNDILKFLLPNKLVCYPLIKAYWKFQDTGTNTWMFYHNITKITTTLLPWSILVSPVIS